MDITNETKDRVTRTPL